METIVAVIQTLPLLAQEVPEVAADSGGMQLVVRQLLAVVVFSVVGIVVLCGSFWLMVRLSPFSVKKEIEEDQNTSLGIIMGAVLIGISIIIAAAIIG